MSFLSGFLNTLHAIEAAAAIAAPFVAIADPTIGALVTEATISAVGVEGAITTKGSGAQKAAVVLAQTAATVSLINAVRISQGRPQLPANVTDQVTAQVSVVVAGLNAVASAKAEVPEPSVVQ